MAASAWENCQCEGTILNRNYILMHVEEVMVNVRENKEVYLSLAAHCAVVSNAWAHKGMKWPASCLAAFDFSVQMTEHTLQLDGLRVACNTRPELYDLAQMTG